MFSGQAQCSEVNVICEHGAPVFTSLHPCLLHMWFCCVFVSGRSSWFQEGLLKHVFVVSWFLGGPPGLRRISFTHVCYICGFILLCLGFWEVLLVSGGSPSPMSVTYVVLLCLNFWGVLLVPGGSPRIHGFWEVLLVSGGSPVHMSTTVVFCLHSWDV